MCGALGVDVRSGEMWPATFPDKGPDMAVRSATNFVGSKTVRNTYTPIQYVCCTSILMQKCSSGCTFVLFLSFSDSDCNDFYDLV